MATQDMNDAVELCGWNDSSKLALAEEFISNYLDIAEKYAAFLQRRAEEEIAECNGDEEMK